jgi:hypothetical protein
VPGEGPSGGGCRRSGVTIDRPWLESVAAPVDRAVVAAWRRDAGRRRADADRGAPAESRLQPGISVVVPSYRGRHHIERCLRSLAGQTLDRARYEVIVVLNGPPDGTREVIDKLRASEPELDLRVIELDVAGASVARNAGVAAARRAYTTFVDHDDYVSPAYLEVLLTHAGPHVVPVVPVVDVTDAGETTDNYINRRLAPHLGRLTAPADVTVATSFNAAKALATDLARQVPYDPTLRTGEDVVFWTTVAVRGQVEFLPCPAESGALYYRRVRAGSISRRDSGTGAAVARLDTLARLDRLLPQVHGRDAELVRDRMVQTTRFVNAHLRERPDTRPEVVAAIDRRAILHLPHEELNRGLATGIVAAYAFAPYADTSAVVTAKRMRDRGGIGDVVCNTMDGIRGTDRTLGPIYGPFVERRAQLQTPVAFMSWAAFEAFALAGLRTIRAWEQAGRRYEWLYSRAQFPASHLLAAAYKLTNPQVRWVAEFSDPLSRDVHGAQRGDPVTGGGLADLIRRGMRRRDLPLPRVTNSLVWAEELVYALADEIVFTNDHQRDYMLSYCSRDDLARAARARSVVSPHPTLPPEFYRMVECGYPLEDGLVHLGYFGNFYANRGPGTLLSALAALDRRTRARVKVHVFTTRPQEVVREAAERGVADSVQAAPYLGYLEFLNLTTRLDALVVADAATSGRHARNPYLPSKWSDYRGSGTPVWGLVEDGSPLSAQPLDFRSPLDDPGAGADVIAELVRRSDR